MTHPRDAQRPGETRLSGTLPDAAGLCFVGTVHTPFAARAECPRQGDPDSGPLCHVVVLPDLRPALDGIAQFTHLELYYWLHEARRDMLQLDPRREGDLRGVFSLRAPLRPNPIGMSVVRLVAVTAQGLRVRGLDCIDGTPLLDIKPERCAYSVQAPPKTAPKSVTG